MTRVPDQTPQWICPECLLKRGLGSEVEIGTSTDSPARKAPAAAWALDTVETRDAKMVGQTSLDSLQGNCTWETSPQFRDTLQSSTNRSAPSMIAMKSAEATPLITFVVKEFSQCTNQPVLSLLSTHHFFRPHSRRPS
jgi:hypothetical protein